VARSLKMFLVAVSGACAVVALACGSSWAQLTEARIDEQTTSTWQVSSRRFGDNNEPVEKFMDLGTLWRIKGHIFEYQESGRNDVLDIVLDTWHVTAPHGEAENALHYYSPDPYLVFQIHAAEEYKSGPWTEGSAREAKVLPHENHWDVFAATAAFVVAPAYDILSWSWQVVGQHVYKKESIPCLGGHVSDGQSTDHLGSVVMIVDTENDQVTVGAHIHGITAASVLGAVIRAGAGGPVIVTLPSQTLSDDQGWLSIDAPYVNFAPAGVAALLGNAYVEVTTAQGGVGGLMSPIEERTVGVGPSPSVTRLELEAPYPNPARATIGLRYRLPSSRIGDRVELSVHDVSGRRLRAVDCGAVEEVPGFRALDLRTDDGAALRAGLYFVTLRVGTQTATRRFVVAD
jgi:hypothetical protein